MSNLKVVELANERYEDDAIGVLKGAIEKRFKGVIVFGFDGVKVHIQKSADKNTLELLGALEAAKQHIWGNS